MSVEAVLGVDRGLIVAPAGCGKTHLITETLKVNIGKPYLVLTHTTAGVAALKQRLKRLRVPTAQYVVATIDGWAKHISKLFPASCPIVEVPENPKQYYPELRAAVHRYVIGGHITDIIQASYSRLLVDEYQDCNVDQHALICALSEILPTIVFGDPMQGIFDFTGPMPAWEKEVQARFPLLCQLDTPWRWNNSGSPNLGQWILECRELLQQGSAIDLASCPNHVEWVQLTGDYRKDSENKIKIQYALRKNNSDSLLIIGDQYRAILRHKFASTARGIDVVEPVELSDVVGLASSIDQLTGIDLARQLLTSVTTMMTGVGTEAVLKRVATILAGRNRTPETDTESAVKNVVEQGDNMSIASLLACLELSPDTRIFRRGAFSALKSAVSLSISDPSKTMKQAAEVVREQRRHQGDRRIPAIAIGSTLLLKGLEADHVLILDAGEMDVNNLYVALSRGAKSITAFSSNRMVGQ